MFKGSNRPFTIAAIIALIVTVLLAKNRNWNVDESFNESIIEAWATSMAAIFTALTVYLLYRQNEQQLDDRNAASKPDIYPAEANVLTKDEAKNEVHEYGQGQEQRIKVFFQQNNGNLEKDYAMYIPILLHNIGLAAAKRVKYKWQFDRREVYNYVQGAYFLPIPSEEDTMTHQETNVDFIAATNSVTIYMPYYYCTCFGLSVNVNNDEGFLKTLPELQLNIDYLDNHDNPFPKIFKVSFSRIFEFVNIKFNEIRR